jgi:hypothetical protein
MIDLWDISDVYPILGARLDLSIGTLSASGITVGIALFARMTPGEALGKTPEAEMSSARGKIRTSAPAANFRPASSDQEGTTRPLPSGFALFHPCLESLSWL